MSLKPLVLQTLTAAATLMLAAGLSHAQCGSLKFQAQNGHSASRFGHSLAMSASAGNGAPRVMIGAPGQNQQGLVYTYALYDNNQWGPLSTLTPNDPQQSARFGYSVGFADPYAVVGAYNANTGGAVYFFERTGVDWVQRSKLTLFNPALHDDYGAAVAMDGEWAVVGAPGRDFEFSHNAGAAYFYRRQANGTWSQVHAVLGDSLFGWETEHRIGSAVAMGGQIAVIGAPSGSFQGEPAAHGYVKVYRRNAANQWTFDAQLSAPAHKLHAFFGQSVATDGTFIAVGAPWEFRSAAEGGEVNLAGAVHVYRYAAGAWTHEQTIFAPDAVPNGKFGHSVAVRDGRLIVGADLSAKAYVYRRIAGSPARWVMDEIISDPDGQDEFGGAVAFNGTTVVIGDPGDEAGASNKGAIYIRNPATAYSSSCEGAVAITPGSITGGCTIHALRDGTTTCGNPAIQGPDVWFKWTAECSGQTTFDTIGSNFDTVLSVHTGCPTAGGSNTVVCNDDFNQNTTSSVTFQAQAGTTYLIRVSGFGGAMGTFVLRHHEQAAPANDTCPNAEPIGNGSYTFATCRATGSGPDAGGCYASPTPMNRDVWFRYTAPTGGSATVNLCGSNFDTMLAVYPGGACPTQPGAAIACNDDAPIGAPCGGTLQSSVTFPVTQGQQYLIRVGGYWNAAGNVQMTVSSGTNCPADWNGDGTVNSSDISAFITTWLSSINGNTLAADFNGDNAVNSSDISAFITAWLAAVQHGC